MVPFGAKRSTKIDSIAISANKRVIAEMYLISTIKTLGQH